MDKPVKEIKSKSEIRRFFNNKIVNSEKVVIDGKTMYMTVNKIDDSGKEVKHKKNTKSKIREKRTEMNQTLNFPDIDYQKSKLPELKKNNVDKSIITNTRKIGHVYKGFEFLNELEEYLFERISSFSNIKEISDEELIDIFHNIQIWGG